MKQPDRFERMVEEAHKQQDLIDLFSKRGTLLLLRRQYAAIRREIRRQHDTHQDPAALAALTALLDRLDRWRRGTP